MAGLSIKAKGVAPEVFQHHEFKVLIDQAPIVPRILPAACRAVETDASDQKSDRTRPLITFESVNARFGDKLVFSNFSWQKDWGDHVLIEGQNGICKSTLPGLIDGDNHKAYGQAVTLFGRRPGSG